MKNIFTSLCLLLGAINQAYAQAGSATSGNPIIKGWYADPEAAIFNKQYWIYPTYSDVYEKQVFFDAFSSTDLVYWTTHSHILDTAAVKWARRAMWGRALAQARPRAGGKFAGKNLDVAGFRCAAG